MITEKQAKIIISLLTEIRDILKGSTKNTAIKNSQNTNKDWDVYLEQKKPKNDFERVALIVDYLTKNEKNGVTKEEIIEFIRKKPSGFSNTKKMKQVIVSTKANKSYGYIEFINQKEKGEKRYRLSVHGSQHIKEMPKVKNKT